MRNITVQEYIDAVRKNGYEQIRGILYNRHGTTNEIQACAFGQALLNLGIHKVGEERIQRNYFDETSIGERIKNTTFMYNDELALSLQEIADRLTVEYADDLDYIAFTVENNNA